jgi:uncharacterized glyoxalase superfamily protein PhnB
MSDRERLEPQFDELEAALSALAAGRDMPAEVGGEVRELALIAAHLLGLPGEDFRARLKADLVGARDLSAPSEPPPIVAPEAQGIVPYIVHERAAELADWVERAFGAREIHRTPPGAGGFHAEMQIGDAQMMMGGFAGMPFPQTAASLHLYVPDADATYRKAVDAGASSIYEPVDQPYGDREGGVRDPFGNSWFIGTHRAGASHVPSGLKTLTPHLIVRGAGALIDLAREAFGAEVIERHEGPDGVVRHAQLRVAGGMIELGEAQDRFPPIPAMLYVYVDDVDTAYTRAVKAGGRSKQAPADQPYGHRTAAVEDGFGNQWYLAKPIR